MEVYYSIYVILSTLKYDSHFLFEMFKLRLLENPRDIVECRRARLK